MRSSSHSSQITWKQIIIFENFIFLRIPKNDITIKQQLDKSLKAILAKNPAPLLMQRVSSNADS